ncbi:ornithine cyclodeaminase family protein [Phenylobacterium sp.]|uniref:ornithine cyclodeaminase family protein n=1 Tax=Phenylobacterium sp. TaxID=1871053 RepID=UPI002EDAD149
MRVIGDAEAAALVTLEAAIDAVEAVFIELARGRAHVFSVAVGEGPHSGDRFAMKSGRLDRRGVVGLKVGTYWPGNPARGLESHGSTTLLLDAETGYPRAVIGATALTALRTAAADGVAIRALARTDADVVGLVGAGHQAWFDLRAACAVRPIREVRVWNRNAERAEALAARAEAELGVRARSTALEAAVRDAPIVVCATAADGPLVDASWIAPGAHVSAMGADTAGKQELDIELVSRARLFADVAAQAVTIGEFQTAARAGRIGPHDITPLGAVLDGQAAGRLDSSEVTVFDSSGVAVQDLAVADLVLRAIG